MLKHLDQQMRAYYVPPSLRVPGFGGAKLNQDIHPPSPELTMQRHFLVALKEISTSTISSCSLTFVYPFVIASFYMHRYSVQRHTRPLKRSRFFSLRGFFIRAMNEKPENPVEHHPYGESVQTIYDSACICVGLMRSLFRQQPLIMQRFPYFFDHIFSCSVSVILVSCLLIETMRTHREFHSNSMCWVQ